MDKRRKIMSAKIKESHNLSIEGVLDIDANTGVMEIEVEEVGKKTIHELATRFNGELIKITFALKNEIHE